MTDRLTTLLQDQAAGLDVPLPPAVAVISEGRAIRRRRRAAVVASAAAVVVAVVAGGLALGTQRSDRDPEPVRPSDATAYRTSGAWAIGDEVHVGNHVVVVPDTYRLFYTSQGVVVLTADSGLVLVGPSGDTERIDVDLADPMAGSWGPVATNPAQPYLAYEHLLPDGRVQATVRDLATDEETTVGAPIEPRPNESYIARWLSGDLATFTSVDRGRFVSWRTGEPATVASGWWYASGVALDWRSDGIPATWTARTFDGERLLSVTPPDPASTYASLSPDGRYLAFTGADPTIMVYSLATGESRAIEDRAMVTFGWSPDGHLVGTPSMAGGEVEVCDPATATCEGTGTEVGSALTVVTGDPGHVM